MFERHIYQCPSCGSGIRQDLGDTDEFVCGVCNRRFRVLMTDGTANVGFIEVTSEEVPEPLHLPKGSVRALVTLGVAVVTWILMVRGDPIPEYVLSLLLAIIGYYFGFRQKMKAAESRILDVTAEGQEPLFLPSGVIRWFLISGFTVVGVLLYTRGRLVGIHYAGFFGVLAGLVVGYLYAKAVRAVEATPLLIFISHLKGIVVLGSAIALGGVLLSRMYWENPYWGLALSAAISFYFGSRS